MNGKGDGGARLVDFDGREELWEMPDGTLCRWAVDPLGERTLRFYQVFRGCEQYDDTDGTWALVKLDDGPWPRIGRAYPFTGPIPPSEEP